MKYPKRLLALTPIWAIWSMVALTFLLLFGASIIWPVLIGWLVADSLISVFVAPGNGWFGEIGRAYLHARLGMMMAGLALMTIPFTPTGITWIPAILALLSVTVSLVVAPIYDAYLDGAFAQAPRLKQPDSLEPVDIRVYPFDGKANVFSPVPAAYAAAELA